MLYCWILPFSYRFLKLKIYFILFYYILHITASNIIININFIDITLNFSNRFKLNIGVIIIYVYRNLMNFFSIEITLLVNKSTISLSILRCNIQFLCIMYNFYYV